MPDDLPNLDNTPRRTVAEEFYGTLYPYVDYRGGMIASVQNPIRRVIYPINPFASQGIPSKDSVAIGERFGNGWRWPINYVSGNVIPQMFPNHFNPDTDEDPTRKSVAGDNLFGAISSPMADGATMKFVGERLPRACNRAKSHYDRCKMVNGAEKCQDEANWTLGVCPNWALAEMSNQKRFEKKVLLIQRNEYRDAMAVSDYNEGRTVADISNKTHIHGTRQYLRPDTMWADERYRNVTKDEIKAAKERHEARLQAAGRFNTPLNPAPHSHDNTGASERLPRPLY